MGVNAWPPDISDIRLAAGISMCHRCHDDAVGFGHRHRGFGSKFVFLVLLAFGHAGDVRLVQRVNLVGILRLLGQHPTVKGEVLSLFFSEAAAAFAPARRLGLPLWCAASCGLGVLPCAARILKI